MSMCNTTDSLNTEFKKPSRIYLICIRPTFVCLLLITVNHPFELYCVASTIPASVTLAKTVKRINPITLCFNESIRCISCVIY